MTSGIAATAETDSWNSLFPVGSCVDLERASAAGGPLTAEGRAKVHDNLGPALPMRSRRGSPTQIPGQADVLPASSERVWAAVWRRSVECYRAHSFNRCRAGAPRQLCEHARTRPLTGVLAY